AIYASYARCTTLAPSFFFFFQAEDGIRDATVTGVQTCALPISPAAGDDEDRDVVHRGHSRERVLEGSRQGAVERVQRPGAVEAEPRHAVLYVEVDHCNEARGTGAIRGWPETRSDLAPSRTARFIPAARRRSSIRFPH